MPREPTPRPTRWRPINDDRPHAVGSRWRAHARVFPDAEPKTIRLTLAADEEIPAHTHPDREIVLYLVSGKLELHVGNETDTLEAGDVARFDGEREISPRAIEASTALLVLAPRA